MSSCAEHEKKFYYLRARTEFSGQEWNIICKRIVPDLLLEPKATFCFVSSPNLLDCLSPDHHSDQPVLEI